MPTLVWHGLCYDGCSTMAGARGDVAAKVQQIEYMAIFYTLHDNAHSLNASDTIRGSAAMKDCLEICFELVIFLKFFSQGKGYIRLVKKETKK